MRPLPLFLSLFPLILLAAGCGTPRDDAYQWNQTGNRSYQKGAYAEALEAYRQAQVLRPELPHLNFNAGAALHQRGEYDRALRELRRAVSSQDLALSARTYYNLGNTLYRLGRVAEAIEEYKQALRIDPTDQDAKYNLEYALRQLQRPTPEEPREGSSQEGVAGQEQGEPDEPGELSAPSPQRSAEELLQRALVEAGEEMSLEEALRILDALRERERELRILLEGPPSGKRDPGIPDW